MLGSSDLLDLSLLRSTAPYEGHPAADSPPAAVNEALPRDTSQRGSRRSRTRMQLIHRRAFAAARRCWMCVGLRYVTPDLAKRRVRLAASRHS